MTSDLNIQYESNWTKKCKFYSQNFAAQNFMEWVKGGTCIEGTFWNIPDPGRVLVSELK